MLSFPLIWVWKILQIIKWNTYSAKAWCFVAKCFTPKQRGTASAKTHCQIFYLSFGKFSYSLEGFLVDPAEFIVNIFLGSAVFSFQEGFWPHKHDLSVKSAKLLLWTHKEPVIKLSDGCTVCCPYRCEKTTASGHSKAWPHLVLAGFTEELQQRVMEQSGELQLVYVEKTIKPIINILLESTSITSMPQLLLKKHRK